MDTTRQDIAERYTYLGDDELLGLFRSGDLTEQAQGIAVEELAKRGLDPSRNVPADLPSSAENSAERAERWRSMLFALRRVYFVAVVGLWTYGVVLFAWQGAYTTQPTRLINIGSTIVDALCITALYGANRARALLFPGIWQVAWVVFTGTTLVSIGYFTYWVWRTLGAYQLDPARFSHELWAAVLGLVTALALVPLLWMVFNYAFRSPMLWQRQPTGTAAQTEPGSI